MNLNFRKDIPIVLFTLLLILDVSIMLLEKIATNHVTTEGILLYIELIKLPWTWLALFLAPFQLFVWTKILKKTELSLAYPIASFSYPLVMLAAQLILKEHLGCKVWFGALLVTAGVQPSLSVISTCLLIVCLS